MLNFSTLYFYLRIVSVGMISSETGGGVDGGGGAGIGWHLCLGGGLFSVSFGGALCCAISVGTQL